MSGTLLREGSTRLRVSPSGCGCVWVVYVSVCLFLCNMFRARVFSVCHVVTLLVVFVATFLVGGYYATVPGKYNTPWLAWKPSLVTMVIGYPGHRGNPPLSTDVVVRRTYRSP